ncbi:MAG: hypothetical protein ACTSV7_04555 [Candidatus Baldrarchaeia archaeon]
MKDIVTVFGMGTIQLELEPGNEPPGFPAFRFILFTALGIIRKGAAYK